MSSDYTLEENRDGSAIVKLARPLELDGRQLSRLTIPALTGRHLRKVPWSYTKPATLGEVATFAADVIEPEGALDALPAKLANDLAAEVLIRLGKSQATGEAPSPT